MSSSNENVGVALALVVAAGASTALGAAVVFFPSIVKLASRRVLAGSLGFSGGVMTYVSYVEIFQKSVMSFENAGHAKKRAYSYATICFFGGVFMMMLLNAIVSYLLGGGHQGRQGGGGGGSSQKHSHKKGKKSKGKKMQRQHTHSTSRGESDSSNKDENLYKPACCSKDPVERLNRVHDMANELQGNHEEKPEGDMEMDLDIEDDFVDNLPLEDTPAGDGDSDGHEISDEFNDVDTKNEEENKRLVRMGINTAVAIGLHNFPEGLATFVAALDDPRVGAVLAFAIAIHNIPEGLCVALPIYYATGNRLNAFFWALLSGASEFIAALLGWAVLANKFTDSLYASLFGIVAGMMAIISIRELLPTAHFYDPEDTVVTYTYIAGMILMAASLILFTI